MMEFAAMMLAASASGWLFAGVILLCARLSARVSIRRMSELAHLWLILGALVLLWAIQRAG